MRLTTFWRVVAGNDRPFDVTRALIAQPLRHGCTQSQSIPVASTEEEAATLLATGSDSPRSVVFVATAGVRPAQVVLVDVFADPPPLLGAPILIEAEVDPAIDTRVVDIVGDLLEFRVLEGHA